MNLALNIIAIGIIATLAMTAFSYALSAITNSKFEEPQLINILFKRAGTFSFPLVREHILGWTIHFIIGIAFVVCYYVSLPMELFDTTVLDGAIFGFLAGLIGALFWGTTLKLHPNPPKINKIGYLLQLIPAHIIFGITMVLIIQAI
ncbi:hypothetical protein ACFQ3R_09905 [Mesonia ostreae]|uniref:DUF2938 domain-containing protein n=1 Tax=Mesonia ostreae TaxID=861110 RepID=A0ABU2KE87_9FLAO|nr:hypothetical protein [Mesonia ostreae]MDT0293021.1 hypothetical protein [Mesonia ostreae]